MAKKIKKCPFCSGQMKLMRNKPERNAGYFGTSCYCYCIVCGARTGKVYYSDYETKEQAETMAIHYGNLRNGNTKDRLHFIKSKKVFLWKE